MNLTFLTPCADHHPGPHATCGVIGEQAAGCRAFIIRMRADHEQRYAWLMTALGAARCFHILSSLSCPFRHVRSCRHDSMVAYPAPRIPSLPTLNPRTPVL